MAKQVHTALFSSNLACYVLKDRCCTESSFFQWLFDKRIQFPLLFSIIHDINGFVSAAPLSVSWKRHLNRSVALLVTLRLARR